MVSVPIPDAGIGISTSLVNKEIKVNRRGKGKRGRKKKKGETKGMKR